MAKSVVIQIIKPNNSQVTGPFSCRTNQGTSLGTFTLSALTASTIVSVQDEVVAITCDSLSGACAGGQETALITPYVQTYAIYSGSQRKLCPSCSNFGSPETISIPTNIAASSGQFIALQSQGQGWVIGTYVSTSTTPQGVILIGGVVYSSCTPFCSV